MWKWLEYGKDSAWLMFLQLALFCCRKYTVGEDCLWFYLLKFHVSSVKKGFTSMTDHYGMGISSCSVLRFLYNLAKSYLINYIKSSCLNPSSHSKIGLLTKDACNLNKILWPIQS